MPPVESRTALLFVGPQHTDERRPITNAIRKPLEDLPPLGIAIVSALLKRYGIETKLITMDPNPHVDYSDPISRADAVFVSSRQFDTSWAQRIIETAGRFGKITVAGGYGPTFNPDAFAAATTRVFGEAEPVLGELIEGWLSGRSLPPVYDATIRPPFDLSQYVWPDRTIFPPSRSPIQQHPQEWQRGCLNRCSFCSPSRMQGPVRFRSPEDILNEIHSMHLERGSYIFSVDLNTSAIPSDKLRVLFTALKAEGLRWSTEGTVASLIQDFEINGVKGLLGLMSGADPKNGGCYSFLYGADDLCSPKVRGAYDKNLSDLQTAISLFRKFSIPFNLSVVVGLDNHVYPDSLFEIASTIEELAPAHTFFQIATPLKGTPWGDSLDKEGRIFDRESTHYNHNQVVHSPKNMTPEQLQQGYYWLLRTLYNPAQIARSFQKNFSVELFRNNWFLALMATGIHWQTQTWTGIIELTTRGYLNREIQKALDYEYQRWKGDHFPQKRDSTPKVHN